MRAPKSHVPRTANMIQEGWDISPQGRMSRECVKSGEWLARMVGKKVVERPSICPPLFETIYSVGFEHQERTLVKLTINGDAVDLNMIGYRVPMSRDWVRYNPSALVNWQLILLPALLESSEM
ncbi:hypothetical protein GOBAR_DD16417 [Gossypium barbadense]|nr:hypothetical protein GOBAR_DD16417 [Gossypium barbadense]